MADPTPNPLAPPEDLIKQKHQRMTKMGLIAAGVISALVLVIAFSFPFRDQLLQIFFGREPTEAWLTKQNAGAYCTDEGTVGINVSFSNTEPDKPIWCMKVVAIDQQSGKRIDFGNVNAGDTVTGDIDIGESSITSGQVKFELTWCDGRSGSDVRYAQYDATTCQEPSPTPTLTPTLTPTPPETITPSPSTTPGVTVTPTPTQGVTPSITLTPTPGISTTPTPTTPSVTSNPSSTPTNTPTATPTPTTPIGAPLSTPTLTPAPTSSPTPIVTTLPESGNSGDAYLMLAMSLILGGIGAIFLIR